MCAQVLMRYSFSNSGNVTKSTNSHDAASLFFPFPRRLQHIGILRGHFISNWRTCNFNDIWKQKQNGRKYTNI
ncbi:hypothetical protein ILYODFUR_009612 [Ilyodon furcidens]|uniref:Uncharacterized protein n=1 Tax=Ilyodon furcidens TaxID=33524 RepID=A0ABV0THI3_9TELE